MKRLLVPAATGGDESATYDVIVYKNEGEDARILYQTVKNNGNEILKKYWEDTVTKKDGANSNGQISTYTVDGQTLEDYGLNLLFLFDNQDSWQKRVEIIEAILPLLLLLIMTVICIMQTSRLYRRYDYFMRGKDAESMEEIILNLSDEIKELKSQGTFRWEKRLAEAMRLLSWISSLTVC